MPSRSCWLSYREEHGPKASIRIDDRVHNSSALLGLAEAGCSVLEILDHWGDHRATLLHGSNFERSAAGSHSPRMLHGFVE